MTEEEMKLNKLPDWAIRTIKTFVQVFVGTLVAAIIPALGVPPETWGEVFKWFLGLFTPQLIIGDCLSAAFCAIWNYSIGNH